MTPVWIVDTNVLASGLITKDRGSPVARIVDDMLRGTITYLLSPPLLDEYRAVLLRPKLSRLHRFTEQEIDTLLIEVVANAIWREPESVGLAPDPGDNNLWALMRSHPGNILITGDRLLLNHPTERASVLSPRSYAERFAKRQ